MKAVELEDAWGKIVPVRNRRSPDGVVELVEPACPNPGISIGFS